MTKIFTVDTGKREIMIELVLVYFLLGWAWFCGSLFSYVSECSTDIKMVVRYLAFCLLAWPYMFWLVVNQEIEK